VPSLDFNVGSLGAALAAGAGGVLFLGSAPAPADLASRTAAADRAVPAGVPLLFMADEEGGGVQRLAAVVGSMPWARNMAAGMTTEQVSALAARTAQRMRAAGVAMDLAPVVDVDGGQGPSARDPDGLRSFGADPAVVARYGTAFAQGLRQGGVVAVLKHFPGLGSSTGNTDYGPASTLPIGTLRTQALPPFGAAIASGAPAVMVSNASVPGLTSLPASLSAAVMGALLRSQLGFRGLVLTDSLSAGAIRAAEPDLPHAAAAAVEAGADMVLFGSTLTSQDTAMLAPSSVAANVHAVVSALVTAVAEGSLPVPRLDEAVHHVLAAKGITRLCPGG
jgi:beta-N-acetylhexosaminidase